MSAALLRGLDVLEFLASRGDARVTELMAELEVSRATAFRLLAALEERGYVRHDQEAHVWRLGPAVPALAAGMDSSSILRLSAPALTELRDSTRETVNLAVIQRNRVVWAASFDGAFAIRLSTTIGDEVPVYATAVGKAILAAQPEHEWARLLPSEPFPALTARTRRTQASLAPDIEQARAQGWALDEEESEISGICVAAPIVGRDGRSVAAISVSSVAGRLTPELQPTLGRRVREWCDKISAELVGSGQLV